MGKIIGLSNSMTCMHRRFMPGYEGLYPIRQWQTKFWSTPFWTFGRTSSSWKVHTSPLFLSFSAFPTKTLKIVSAKPFFRNDLTSFLKRGRMLFCRVQAPLQKWERCSRLTITLSGLVFQICFLHHGHHNGHQRCGQHYPPTAGQHSHHQLCNDD